MIARFVLATLFVSTFLVTGCKAQEDAGDRLRAHLALLEARTGTPGEAEDRRQRSMARLRTEGVPVLATLPGIETVAGSRRRTPQEVAGRAIALTVVAMKGSGISAENVKAVADAYHADAYISPAEAAFLADAEPSERDRAQFSWRIEDACVLMWALGRVDRLPRPEATCDPNTVIAAIGPDAGAFVRRAALRPQAELLDAADLLYRYHWATRDAELNHRPAPAGLNGEVVQEWHYALNWLVGYMGQEWDDVTTDT